MLWRVIYGMVACWLFFTANAQPPKFLYKTINHTQGLTSSVPLETMQDSRGLVWIIAYDGLYTYDGFRALRKEVRNCDTCAPSDDFIYGLQELPKGKYWMLTSKGIGSFDPVPGIFTLVKPIPNILWCHHMIVADDRYLQINSCSQGTLLFNVFTGSIEKGGIRYEGFFSLFTPSMDSGYYFRKYPALLSFFQKGSLNRGRTWLKDEAENVWVVDSTGLLLFTPGMPDYLNLEETHPILSGANVTHCRIDKMGIIWLTIQGVGVVMLDTREAVFNAITENSKPATLIKNFVIGIFPFEQDKVAIYPQFDRSGRATILNTKDMTTQILQGKSLAFKVAEMQFLPVMGNKLNTFRKLTEDDELKPILFDGYLFFLGKGGTYFQITNPGSYLQTWPENKELLNGLSIISFQYIGDTLWFGTESHGLVAVDLNSSAVTTLKPSAADGGIFDSWTVFGLVPDDNEHLWLATSRGLWHFNKKNRAFKGYGTTDGLPNPYIYCITKDLNGKLWLGTGNGLSCFDPQTKSFWNYFPADGLVNTEYNRNSAYTAGDGRIFMGGSNGVDFFHPDNVKSEIITAKPFISAVYYQNQPLDPAGGAQLNAGQNSLTFLLGVNEPFKADKYSFQWRLEDSGEEWANIGISRTLNLANLKANDYTLKVRMQDPDGAFTSEETVFSFSIAPYWYETWSFRIMGILLASGILSFLLAYRQRQKIARLRQENEIMRLKAEQESMLQQERERITADLHDDAGATLSSLYIYSDLLKRATPPEQTETKKILEKMVHTAEGLMHRMNDIIWSMKPAGEEKNSLHLRLMNYARDLFDQGGMQIQVDIDPKLDEHIVHPMVRKNISLIVKEAINNAAKYSKANLLNVSLKQQGDNVKLSIKDNGLGFNPEENRKGNGLENMKRRAQQLQGNLEIITSPGKGAEVRGSFPITIISYLQQKGNG